MIRSPGRSYATVEDRRSPRDHIKLVGNEKSTGKFIYGKSVPRSRPTMFWEH